MVGGLLCCVTVAVYANSKASLVVLHLCDLMLISHILCHTTGTKGVIGGLRGENVCVFFFFL